MTPQDPGDKTVIARSRMLGLRVALVIIGAVVIEFLPTGLSNGWGWPLKHVAVVLFLLLALFVLRGREVRLSRMAGMETGAMQKYGGEIRLLSLLTLLPWIAAILLKDRPGMPQYWLWLLAAAAFLGLCGVGVLLYRQFLEENDEYVRQRIMRFHHDGMMLVLLGAGACLLLQQIGLADRINVFWVFVLFLLGGYLGRWHERLTGRIGKADW